MSFDRLEPEIWDNVLFFLSAPFPPSLSGLSRQEGALVMEYKEGESGAHLLPAGTPGLVSRDDLYRNDLCTLARTSIPFHRLACTHLYRRIITSNFIYLTSHLDSPPAHPDIESKAELLGKCRSLFLEYEKPTEGPSYPHLMAFPHLWRDAMTDPADLLWVVTQNIIKLDQLHLHLFQLIRRASPLFPNLRTLAMGSVFGGQGKLWDRTSLVGAEQQAGLSPHLAFAMQTMTMQVASLGISTGPVSKRITACNRMLEIIFARSSLEHYCQRGNTGPLSLPSLVKWGGKFPSTGSPIHTIHFDSQNQSLPVAITHATRWVLEPYERATTIVPQLVNQVNHLVKTTKRERMQQNLPPDGYNLQIYSSCNRYASPHLIGKPIEATAVSLISAKEERDGIATMGRSMLASTAHRSSRPSTDVITWGALIDAPACRACGWAYEG